MPRGPLPQEKHTRDRTPAGTVEQTELAAPARKVKPPALHRKATAKTRAWWRAWVESPQAALFTATDWQRLSLLALLVDAYVKDPTPARLGEIRQNESKYGATPEDRLRLRWHFKDPDDLGIEKRGPACADADRTAKPKRKTKPTDPRLALVKGGKR